jgi:hypothetical protein
MNMQADDISPTGEGSSFDSATTKEVPLMVYTRQSLIWGKVLTRPAIRVSTWMQTEMAPLYMPIVEAQVMMLGGASKPISYKFPTLSLHTDQIGAYHMLPPADESPYYDVDEPHRKMEPVTVIIGHFRFDCLIRMSDQTNLETYLNVSKSVFLPLLDATMSCPVLPAIKGVRAPFVLIRQSEAIFTPRE